ncbi:hypothetical protein BDY24DRAFT_375446 [Mrakia frigida]|uniref:Stb6p n=1 Tax=Mrakia frigida TaxID=29902 RepID=UPI003FCC0A81
MNLASPTSPPQRLNSSTPPPRRSTSSKGGRSTPSASSFRVLIPTLRPKDEDLPRELSNYEIIDEVELKGFKVFAVGPWMCDRYKTMPLFLEWTGVEQDTAKAYVLHPFPYISLADAEEDQRRTIEYLSHSGMSRVRETPHGKVLAVSSSSYPVGLSPMQVHGGDFRGSRDSFYATINLLRMGLTGRAQLEPGPVNEQIRANFLKKYCLPENIAESANIIPTTIFLVQLLQAALAHFSFYTFPIDGLLCNDTMGGLDRFEELVANNWAPESHNTFLETDMVVRVLSTVWATRMRLVELGFDKSSKDPFYEMGDFDIAFKAFQKSRNLNPPSPYLTRELLQLIHDVHSASVQSDSKKITKKVLQKFSLTTLFHPHHHLPPSPISDGDDHNRAAGEEIEASKIEDFVRNIKLYSKRDKMDSLRFLWLGEGTKPENLWEDANERWLEDGRRSAETKRGRMRKLAGKVRGIGSGKKNAMESGNSDSEPHYNPDSIPIVMISEGEGLSDGEFSASSPIPSPSPYNEHLQSAPSSVDFLHLPASNAPFEGSSASLQADWGSLTSQSGASMTMNARTRRRGLKRAWTLESWFDDVQLRDWRHRREEARAIDGEGSSEGVPLVEEMVDDEVWSRSLKRSHSYDFAAEYKDTTVLSREHLKVDMALYDALVDLRIRQAHLAKMARRFEVLAEAKAGPRGSLAAERKARAARIESIRAHLQELPQTEPYLSLMVPISSDDNTIAGLQQNQKVERVSYDTGQLKLNTSWEELVREKTGLVFDNDGEVVEDVGIAGDGSSATKEGEGTTGGWLKRVWKRS